jgi:parallel beta-helix repeat protein
MKFLNYITSVFIVCMIVCFCACNQPATENDGYNTTLTFSPGDEKKIMEAFLSIKDSTQILLKAGDYKFDNLSIAQGKHIKIKGEGFDKTSLDFSSQATGGEGIRVTGVVDFIFSDITIHDSKGDLIKMNKCSKVVVADVHATWKNADSTSGGYAIYPVLCKNVLIENCYVEGSSDAGIYVGQTDSAIVRNCKAAKNVAGCEIENTLHAEVYDNEFYDNTAGFLIFDLPGLSQRGGHTKAYHNYFHDNNSKNFAKAGSFGTTWGVGNAAPGSGVVILAASNIELYDNRIINNNTSSIIIASGFAVDDKAAEKINENYFPISSNIKIYNNTMQMGDKFPEAVYQHHIGKLLVGIEEKLKAEDTSRKNMRIPFIMYDGISKNMLTKQNLSNPDSICISQQGSNLFVNADFINISNQAKWHPDTNMSPYVCK